VAGRLSILARFGLAGHRLQIGRVRNEHGASEPGAVALSLLLLLAAFTMLAAPAVRAHEIPVDVRIRLYLHPEGDALTGPKQIMAAKMMFGSRAAAIRTAMRVRSPCGAATTRRAGGGPAKLRGSGAKAAWPPGAKR